MVNEFELEFDKQIKKLRERYCDSLVEKCLFYWLREHKIFFASDNEKKFFDDMNNKIRFIGMLLSHIVKLDNYYTRNPNVSRDKISYTKDVLKNEIGKNVRVYYPNVTYTEYEIMEWLKEEDIETALHIMKMDDYVLENMIKSLVYHRYTKNRKKALDSPKTITYAEDESIITSENIFLAIESNIEETVYTYKKSISPSPTCS